MPRTARAIERRIKSQSMKITQYKALGFSCYGTLVDRNRGVLEALRPLLERSREVLPVQQLLALYRTRISERRLAAPGIGQLQLHCQVHEDMARTLGVPVDESADWEQAMAFGKRIGQWPIYEDVPGALQYLSKFYRLVLLMPADAGTSDAVSERLPVALDALVVYQADDRRQALADTLAAVGVSRQELLPVRSEEADDPWRDLIDFPVCTLRRDTLRPWNHTQAGLDSRRCEFASMADLVLAHQNALRL